MYCKTVAVALAALLGAIAYAQDAQPQSRARGRSMSDQQFLTKAAEGGKAEVQMGQLASQNGSNSCVKQFGERMVADHSKANDQAKAVAAQKGIILPASMNSKDESLYRSLSAKTGAEFDKAYMTAMINDHREDIAEFRQEANSGNDPDIKSWAAKTLPVLEEHLRSAESCGKQVGVTTAPTGGDLR